MWDYSNVPCGRCGLPLTGVIAWAGPLLKEEHPLRCPGEKGEEMKIVQKPTEGACEAMRCDHEATVVVPLDPFLSDMAPTKQLVFRSSRVGSTVSLCDRCTAKALIAFGVRPIGEAPGAPPVGMMTKGGEHNASPEVMSNAQANAEIAEHLEYATETISLMDAFTIETRDEYALAAEMLAEVKGKAKALTAKKEEITKPMNAALAATRNLFRPAENALATAETVIKRAIGAFTVREEAAKREALEAASQAHAAGDTIGVSQALERVVTTKNVAGVTTRAVWKFEVTDADLVPDGFAFRAINEAAIKAYLNALPTDGPLPVIPGVRVVLDTIVSSRAS